MEINRFDCPINLGRILLDNKENVKTIVTGCVIKKDDLSPVSDTMISIMYD